MKNIKNENVKNEVVRQARRSYQAPKLVVYGDVRQLTEGGSGNALEDSNNTGSDFARS